MLQAHSSDVGRPRGPEGNPAGGPVSGGVMGDLVLRMRGSHRAGREGRRSRPHGSRFNILAQTCGEMPTRGCELPRAFTTLSMAKVFMAAEGGRCGLPAPPCNVAFSSKPHTSKVHENRRLILRYSQLFLASATEWVPMGAKKLGSVCGFPRFGPFDFAQADFTDDCASHGAGTRFTAISAVEDEQAVVPSQCPGQTSRTLIPQSRAAAFGPIFPVKGPTAFAFLTRFGRARQFARHESQKILLQAGGGQQQAFFYNCVSPPVTLAYLHQTAGTSKH